MAGRFRRLAALRFSQGNDAILLTVTRPDGAEEYAVLAGGVGTLEMTNAFKEITMKLNNKKTAGNA